MKEKLTDKEEAFCQAYILIGNKSAAYREVYSTKNAKPSTINRAAIKVYQRPRVTQRVEELQKQAAERNKIELDDLIQMLSSMARFDIGSLYDDEGKLKPVSQMPIEGRKMIQQIETIGGYTDKIKTYSRLEVIEKLMRHLGGYEKDNEQKGNIVIESREERDKRIQQLIDKRNASNSG